MATMATSRTAADFQMAAEQAQLDRTLTAAVMFSRMGRRDAERRGPASLRLHLTSSTALIALAFGV
jgi:hypothetical protein